MDVHLLTKDSEVAAVAEVLQQLRPQYTLPALSAQIQHQRQAGYQLAFVVAEQQVVCVAGFVVGEKLAWGKHIYVDDLVTAESHRSTGAGALLLEWLKTYANSIGCGQLHLDSGVQRFAAHRFYLAQRFEISSHHFALTEFG